MTEHLSHLDIHANPITISSMDKLNTLRGRLEKTLNTSEMQSQGLEDLKALTSEASLTLAEKAVKQLNLSEATKAGQNDARILEAFLKNIK